MPKSIISIVFIRLPMKFIFRNFINLERSLVPLPHLQYPFKHSDPSKHCSLAKHALPGTRLFTHRPFT